MGVCLLVYVYCAVWCVCTVKDAFIVPNKRRLQPKVKEVLCGGMCGVVWCMCCGDSGEILKHVVLRQCDECECGASFLD